MINPFDKNNKTNTIQPITSKKIKKILYPILKLTSSIQKFI